MSPTFAAVLALLSLFAIAVAFVLASLAFRRLVERIDALTEAFTRLAEMRPVTLALDDAQPPGPPALSPDALRARIQAAEEAGDVEGLLADYDQLAPRLSAMERGPLDARLVHWFMDRLMKRMRGGSVTTEVVVLAARVAERFSATREGAALRASLPTLRRSAGLCAECARPYNGVEDACPECMARKFESGPATLPLHAEWAPDDAAGTDASAGTFP